MTLTYVWTLDYGAKHAGLSLRPDREETRWFCRPLSCEVSTRGRFGNASPHPRAPEVAWRRGGKRRSMACASNVCIEQPMCAALRRLTRPPQRHRNVAGHCIAGPRTFDLGGEMAIPHDSRRGCSLLRDIRAFPCKLAKQQGGARKWRRKRSTQLSATSVKSAEVSLQPAFQGQPERIASRH